MTTAVSSERRESYLAPYLDDLRRFVRASALGKRPLTVQILSRALPVEAWEWDVLVEWCGSGGAGWRSLLASGLALEARCLKDVDHSSPSQDSDLQFDAILGFKLMMGLQRSVERMVLQGRMDQAKKLTLFRHRINESVARIGERIGEEALREAEALGIASGELGAIEEDDAPSAKDRDASMQSLLDLEEKLERIATQPNPTAARPREEAREEVQVDPVARQRTRRLLLASVLGALSVTWFLLIAWPAATRHAVRGFTRADFAAIDAVKDVVARPPSLFVEVDDPKWKHMSEDERRHAVEAVAALIEPAGYTGARFGGQGGATLGQWLKQSGISIADLTKPPS